MLVMAEELGRRRDDDFGRGILKHEMLYLKL